jgi:hypothetical protein
MTELDFRNMLGAAKAGQVLIPAVHVALNNPDFVGFPVDVEPFLPRGYDGRFHPSSHATWTVRQLYLYLVAPRLLGQERMPLTGVLAVTAGKFWHRFFQLLWLKTGHLIRDEVPIVDKPTNRVGHADGVLASGEGLEIKTINEFQINKVDSEAVLKEKKFDYWCQTQDYLDCTGWEVMRYFLINPSYPFAMSEFVVKADHKHQAARRAVYLRALDLAERFPDHRHLDNLAQADIEPCCSPGSKTATMCPTRIACPVGRHGL